MELLYLWINSNDTGYIKQEGFNFSPEYRFIMEYSKERWILKEDSSFQKKITQIVLRCAMRTRTSG